MLKSAACFYVRWIVGFYFAPEERREEMEEINKFLAEAMGECWHESPSETSTYSSSVFCEKCEKAVALKYNSITPVNQDFLTWNGFGKLWTWARYQEWWLKFIKEATYLDNTPEEMDADCYHLKKGIDEFIAPRVFAKAVADFLQKK